MLRLHAHTVLPNKLQVLLFTIISIVILVGGYAGILSKRVFQALAVPKQALYSEFDVYFDYVGQLDVSYYILIGLFWAGVGLLAYLGLWVLGNLLIELHNVATYERYYVNKASLKERIIYFSYRILLAVAVIAAVIITSMYGVPLWFSWFSEALFVSVLWRTGLYAIGSVFGLAANLYSLWVLYKVFRHMN